VPRRGPENRIDLAFARTRAENRAAVIVFVTAGDPDLETTAEMIPELAAAGADIIELGIPHSDPIGEGPTIQISSQRALARHTTLGDILGLVRRVRPVCDVPLVLMGYLNNVLAHGEERLAKDAGAAGADGLIVADVPFEATETLSRACAEHGVHRVLMVAPTSTPERVVRIAAASRGFVYCVSVTGVTGARRELPSDLAKLVARIRRVTPTPVCVGFGVSTPAQAAQVARLADGVIVGSALVSRIDAAPDREAAIRAARAFVAELRAAVNAARG
jgi:tryptophan synthase alpha chain